MSSTTFTIRQNPDPANLYLYPNDDALSQVTHVGETNAYECLDDAHGSPNDDTDFVWSAGAAERKVILGLEDHTTEEGTINFVTVCCRSSTSDINSTGDYNILLEVSGSTYTSDSVGYITPTWTNYTVTRTVSPDSGIAFTWADIDNMKIGFKVTSPDQTDAVMTETIRPVSDSTMTGQPGNNWDTTAPTGYHYTYVDDATPNDDTTAHTSYNANNSYVWEYYGMEPTTGSGIIDYIKMYYRVRTHTGVSRDLYPAYWYSGTTYLGAVVHPTGTWNEYFNTWSANPESSAAWTFDEIDDGEFGFKGEAVALVSSIRLTQMYIVIHYHDTFSPAIRTSQCYALVNYTPASSTVSLTMPESLDVGHGRKVSRHTFWSGNYEVDDYGRSGKTLTLSGTENSDATLKMQSIKDMCHYGAVVTVGCLPDSNLNTDYHIVDFSFRQEGGMPDIYNWTIVLEED